MMRIALAAFGLMVIMAAPAIADDFGELRYYERVDPDKELQKAISRHDLRFLAIQGYGTVVPGVDEEKYKKYGFHVIEGTSDVIYSYEHGRLMVIARYFAEAYNIQLERYLAKQDAEEIAKQLPGYREVTSRFGIEEVAIGNINLLPYSFHAMLASKNKQCVILAWWFDPIKKDKLLYDWNQFFGTFASVNDAVCTHSWIQEWIDAGEGRAAEAQIFGVRPYTETDLGTFVLPAWRAAGLGSEPWYEVNLREEKNWVGTVYIGKDREMALVTHSNAKKSGHWLDNRHFDYHPKAPVIEYIVVNQNGKWSRAQQANAAATKN